ncbi:MAG: hypothetical protein MZV64_35815 [Ignavibacteriales bacterium]|nr:hypothetical protein [Ignavibacteriales bacterium]
MKNSYELSPKLSEQILLTAKESLLREYHLREGQIEVTVIGIEERSGKLIEKMQKKKVRLTIDNGTEDIEAIKEYGRIGLTRDQDTANNRRSSRTRRSIKSGRYKQILVSKSKDSKARY